MAGKVLKIDVLVDESGHARRNLSELEGGVKKVEGAASFTAPSVDKLNAKFAETEKAVTAAEQSVAAIGASTALTTAEFALMTAGIGAAIAVAGAAGSAIYALGVFVKDASEYYIEQSGVLEINAEAVASLTKRWDELRFAVGEAVIGGAGDFRGWVGMVELGLTVIELKLVDDIRRVKELGQAFLDMGQGRAPFGMNPLDPGHTPGIDTSVRNADGSLTPYGRMLENNKRLLDPDRGGTDPLGLTLPTMDPGLAESLTMKAINDQKREARDLEREQLELKREMQKAENELRKYVEEHVKLENDLTNAINRSKDALENEIAAAEKANAKRMQALSASTRDSFLQSSMSPEDFKLYQIQANADRDAAGVDPRAKNAEGVLRQIEAQTQLAILQARAAAEGMTMAMQDEFHAFQIQFADVVGSMPAEFLAIVPPILEASGAMRDGMSGDLDSIRSKTDHASESFAMLGQFARASAQDIAAGLAAADAAYRDAGFFINADYQVSRMRSQQTGGILFAAGGVVEPVYRAGGGPAGTDTVPAWLTPGEGVLSRTGMSALDRLNGGGTVGRGGVGLTLEKGAITIDARGAQFTDDASMDTLAEKVASRLTELSTRIGAQT